MDPRFRHSLKLSAIVHGVLLLALIIAPMIFNWRLRKKRKEIITMVDLTIPMPEIPSPTPEVKQPEPAQKVPEPPKPKTDIPEPEKKPKHVVQKSEKKVKRPPPPKPKTPQLSPEEIRKLLAAGAKLSDKLSVPTDEFPAAWYYALVRQTMYDAWNQPSSLAGQSGLTAEVTIRVLRDGRITEREMTRSSGNSIMDDSVMQAVRAVTQLRALPPQFPGNSYEITIEFELTQGGAF